MQAPQTGDPRIHLRPVRRYGLVFVPLTRRAGGIQGFKVVHPPARGEQTPRPKSHEGYEWFYVLSGRVRLVLGDQDLFLGPGEAAEFDTRVPHWIGNDRLAAGDKQRLVDRYQRGRAAEESLGDVRR